MQETIENKINLRFSQPLKTNDINFHIIIIGAGGTGGYLIPNLSRFIASLPSNEENFKNHIITIVDGDKVEEKNIIRQNFITQDIGRYKAEVLAERYSQAFGIELNAYTEYIETEDELDYILNLCNFHVPIIVGCVDNNKTRQLIHKAFFKMNRLIFWLDGGNEEFSGQVVLGSNYYYKHLKEEHFNPSIPLRVFLSPVTMLYPDILEDQDSKFNSELSCAENAISAPQSITANLTSANIIMNFLTQIMSATNDEGIKTHYVKFNTKNNVITTQMIYKEDVLSNIKAAENYFE